MKWLIFDTETTGLPPKHRLLHPETIQDWPYIVQFSFILFDTETLKTTEYDYVIKAPYVPEESTKIHGITQSMNREQGFPFICIYDIFKLCVEQCDVIIGHNVEFDIKMLEVECMRNSMQYSIQKPIVCTMKSTTKMCNLPNMKWPTLNELHRSLFDTSVIHLHNSIIDVIVCMRCYYWITYKKDLFELVKKYNTRVPTH